jgi:hypothetical protein
VTNEGEKLKPPLPTNTVTVAADAVFRQRATRTSNKTAPGNALASNVAFFFSLGFGGVAAILFSFPSSADAQFAYQADAFFGKQ